MHQYDLDKLRLADNSSNSLLQQYKLMIHDQVRPYEGVYEANWLLSEWGDEKWKTTAGEKTRKNNSGQILGTCDINWSVMMPDGELLTSPRYSSLLETVKKASFLHRMGLLHGTLPSLFCWSRFSLDAINLCAYLILNEDRYRPSEFGFKLFDQLGLENILYLFSKGGWTEALALGKRTVDAFYSATFETPCPADLLTKAECLPEDVVKKICRWLSDSGAYKENEGALDRKFVAEKINAPVATLIGSKRLSAILRQFEPDLNHPTLLIQARRQRTQHFRHRTPIKAEIFNNGNSDTSFYTMTTSVLYLIQSYRHLPSSIPAPDAFKFDTARRNALPNCSQNSHTPFIPIDTGLSYLNESIRWVEIYGDALVDFYLSIIKKISIEVKKASWKTWGIVIFRDYQKFSKEVGLPKVLTNAGFKLGSLSAPAGTSLDFERFQTAPSLQDMIDVFIGAVAVILGFMKPSRDTEICTLPRDCLFRDSSGAYWIDSALAKRTKAEIRSKTGAKPIPNIVAKAIQQMQRLGDGLCKIFDEEDVYMKSRLFYMRNPTNNGLGITINDQMLSSYLDRFCDFVNSPLDAHGRRWYLRIHEMRKWFLLLLFWCGRYDVLDAARWMASHTNIKHIYAYIKRELPATQLGSIEADWAIDQLASYDVSGVTHDNCEGINSLYDQVLKRFNAKSLSFVDSRQWKSYVKALFQSEYHLEPYSIKGDGSGVGICVAIRAEGRKPF